MNPTHPRLLAATMNIEQQVTSLELSKRLKELGVRQESAFWYGRALDEGEFTLGSIPTKRNGSWNGEISAFTVAELGEMLPMGLPGTKGMPGTTLHVGRASQNKWLCGYAAYVQWENPPYLSWNGCETDETEADARAKMLIHLIENKLV